MVLGSHVGMGVGAGLYGFVSSLFVVPLSDAFGWSRGEISSAAAFGLLGTLSAPLVGALADRYGAKRVVLIALCVLGLVFIGMSQMSGPFYQYVIFCSIFGIIAPGCTSITYSRAVTSWFVKARGQALGVMAAGISVGAFLFAPLVAAAIERYGFEGGFLTLATLVFGLGVPAVILAVRERPQYLMEQGSAEQQSTDGRIRGTEEHSLASILRSRGFIALAVAVFSTNAPGAGILTQLGPLLTHNGIASPALMISLFSIAVFIGRIGIGWLFDLTDARKVAAFFSTIAVAGCLLLLSGAPLSLVIIAVILLGLLQGMEVDVIAYFVARQYAPAQFGRLAGILLTISMLGSAVGVVGFGSLYDATASYDTALVGAAIFLVAAIIGYLMIPSPAASSSQR